MTVASATGASDDQLVASARAGSDEAFEELFRRYRDRIVAYVRSIVSDQGRAEDIVQEVFLSALRSLRVPDREIIFRPWIYEIAKNACIDQLRRSKRADLVSIDSDDFSLTDERRLSQDVSGTDSQVSRRHDLNSLRMAFSDLPSSQHRILVMRELEDLSYDKIGRRMGLSRSAVESVLFRARRRLKHEFDDISTGERCRQMQAVMEQLVQGTARSRDRRKLSVHVRDCTSCRREAMVIGLGDVALAGTMRDRARVALSKVAAFLPVPVVLRRRITDSLAGAPQLGGAGVDQGASLLGKVAAVVIAAALVAGGAGVVQRAANSEGGSSGAAQKAVGAGAAANVTATRHDGAVPHRRAAAKARNTRRLIRDQHAGGTSRGSQSQSAPGSSETSGGQSGQATPSDSGLTTDLGKTRTGLDSTIGDQVQTLTGETGVGDQLKVPQPPSVGVQINPGSVPSTDVGPVQTPQVDLPSVDVGH